MPIPGVRDFNDNLMGLVVSRGDIEGAACGGKFRGVLDQVPKDLLQARRIRPAMVFPGLEAV
jgi:hypothetical protein